MRADLASKRRDSLEISRETLHTDLQLEDAEARGNGRSSVVVGDERVDRNLAPGRTASGQPIGNPAARSSSGEIDQSGVDGEARSWRLEWSDPHDAARAVLGALRGEPS